MRLAIISHKVCWKDPAAPDGYATDGGFPRQVEAISELFDETKVVVPVEKNDGSGGLSPLAGKRIGVSELSVPHGTGFGRKIGMFVWVVKNGKIIWREVRRADAIHAPIPGDVGTIGLVFALIQRKPLFVRHCGNWLVQRTAAERFWKWLMEKFAGGRNLMLATGGAEESPSRKNPNVKWIFSTSLRNAEISGARPHALPADGKLKLIIACRQEPRKGTDIVIESLPSILKKFPNAALDVVGDGSLLEELKKRARALGVDDRIMFHGRIEHAQVIALLKQAHVFCFPTSASEGFPKAVLEALACGLPVITTRVSVLPHLIGRDNGILLDGPTPENLAEAVARICADAGRYKKMSENAIAAAQQYSLENWRDFIGRNMRETWNVSALSTGAL